MKSNGNGWLMTIYRNYSAVPDTREVILPSITVHNEIRRWTKYITVTAVDCTYFGCGWVTSVRGYLAFSRNMETVTGAGGYEAAGGM